MYNFNVKQFSYNYLVFVCAHYFFSLHLCVRTRKREIKEKFNYQNYE